MIFNISDKRYFYDLDTKQVYFLDSKKGALLLGNKTKAIINVIDRYENDLRLNDLDKKRDLELSSIVVTNVKVSEEVVKSMAVIYNVSKDDDLIYWIDEDNQRVSFTKAEFGEIIKISLSKISDIYFKYRFLKDEVLNGSN